MTVTKGPAKAGHHVETTEIVVNPKTIVCPIEFSPGDESTLAQALSLARWHEAELHVVHVRRSRRSGSADEVHGTHYELIDRFVESFDPEGINIVTAVLTGDPVLAIAVYARRVGADLVLVAQHARHSSVYGTAGAFAAVLGGAVQCPTIAVPHIENAGRSETFFRNILCAVDLSESSLPALEKALAVAQYSGARLTLLHVLENAPYESMHSGSQAFAAMRHHDARVRKVNRQLRAFIPPDALNWCDVDVETVSGIPHDAILAAATARRADLIVMGLPRRPRLEEFLTSSTVKQVLRRTTRPVLIVPLPSSAGMAHAYATFAAEPRIGANDDRIQTDSVPGRFQ
jgi:nucleotide-binding universal stress UspA family protein